MSLKFIESLLTQKINQLQEQGIAKGKEKVITGIKPASDGFGPRYYLDGFGGREFLRMNSNSYLGLSLHRRLIEAEAEAVERFGTGPGAVRFISGTYQPHKQLENKLAEFHQREAAMLFSAAYATMLGVLPQFISEDTLVVSDALNHNCIINAIRLSHPARKEVYPHNDMQALDRILADNKGQFRRACVVTDGIFSMRGDHAPLDRFVSICRHHEDGYSEGVLSFVDDSHGIAAFGCTGRGTEEVTGARADFLVGTLGKGFGVNGGYVVADGAAIAYLRETAPMYIYSNPITPAEAAAALAALDIVESEEGWRRLETLRGFSARLRSGLIELGYETLSGEHPIVPVFVRDTERTKALVQHLFDRQILATGLNYPVVPKGDQEIRLQLSAEHSEKDVDVLLTALAGFQSV